MIAVLGVALVVAYIALVTAGTTVVARRKGRSGLRWFLGSLVGGLAVFLMALVAAPAGEPWRMRSPLVLLLFTLVFAGPLVLLAVLAQLT